MWDWQIFCLIFSRSSPVKRAGIKASTQTKPFRLSLWENGLCNEGIGNFNLIGRTSWPASKPISSINGKFAHSKCTFLSSSVGRHGYHRNGIFLLLYADCRFSKAHHFREQFFLPSGGSCSHGKIFSCFLSSFSSKPCLVLTRKGML